MDIWFTMTPTCPLRGPASPEQAAARAAACEVDTARGALASYFETTSGSSVHTYAADGQAKNHVVRSEEGYLMARIILPEGPWVGWPEVERGDIGSRERGARQRTATLRQFLAGFRLGAHPIDDVLRSHTLDTDPMTGRIRLHPRLPALVALWWDERMQQGYDHDTAWMMLGLTLPGVTYAQFMLSPDGPLACSPGRLNYGFAPDERMTITNGVG